MRTIALLCGLLLLPPVLLAEDADLEVTSVILDKTTVVTGERYSFTGRIRNNGPAVARNVVALINTHGGAFPLSVVAPPGWTCRRNMTHGPGVKCTTPALGIGAEAEFRGTLLAPQNKENFGIILFIGLGAATTDPVTTERPAPRLTLVESPNVADLGITATPRGGAPEGTQAIVDIAVTNHGPATANDVVVAIDRRDDEFLINPSAAGDGWTCAPSMQGVLCRTATLAVGATSTIVARLTAPAHEAEIDIAAAVQAEMSRDTNWRNDFAVGYLGVGSAESWRRILVPLLTSYLPGANGAEWRTEVTMMIRSATTLDIHPGSCKPLTNPCFPVPLRAPIDIETFLEKYSFWPGGQFLYVRPDDEHKLSFNARIYDQSRMTETAGAEIPIVREHELHTDTISLLGIPVAPQFRHTLRVYGAEARESRMLIHVYAGHETTPRVSVERTLMRAPTTRELTSARLPSHPSYLELSLPELLPLDGLGTLRVEVEPLEPGTRFWAFISITNNDTHHVTTVTPQ